MDTERITVDRAEAAELFRKYKEHQHYSTPVDLEIQRVYDAIRKGQKVIRALESIRVAGLNAEGLPKLAIAHADAQKCALYLYPNGGARMSDNDWQPDRNRRKYIDLPTGTFPASPKTHRHWAAMVPICPIHARPKRGLANYHTLFEAEWSKVVPKDPMLLRRVGHSDLWIVLHAWDLTEVERAVLAGRL